MKKVLSILFVAGMFAFYACGPSAEDKAKAEQAATDSIAKAASDAAQAAASATVSAADSASKMMADTTKK